MESRILYDLAKYILKKKITKDYIKVQAAVIQFALTIEINIRQAIYNISQ